MELAQREDGSAQSLFTLVLCGENKIYGRDNSKAGAGEGGWLD